MIETVLSMRNQNDTLSFMRNRLLISFFMLLLVAAPSRGLTAGVLNGGIIILEDQKYFDTLLVKINEAEKNILVNMYVFKTSPKRSNPANMIRDALIRAAKKGVDVKVLLEREVKKKDSLNEDNEYTASRLVKGGVKVFFDSPLQRTHVKAIVIDNRFTFIGSHNLTASALKYNRELSLLIDSREVAGETTAYIEEMIKKAR